MQLCGTIWVPGERFGLLRPFLTVTRTHALLEISLTLLFEPVAFESLLLSNDVSIVPLFSLFFDFEWSESFTALFS